jgi:16S rRNA (cytosine1402-N4)-methyltransferase
VADPHVPVLCAQVVAHLAPTAPGLLVDLTVGAGGHAAALLDAAPGFSLLGLDRDPEALRLAERRLEPHRDRVQLVCRPFADLPRVLEERRAGRPAAVLADLGCSSMQLDRAERGFSFVEDGPLDMRRGPEGPTAADVVNDASAEELMRILWELGEERRSRAIARALVARRQRAPLSTTRDLARVVVEVLGPARRGRVHPATRTFMALRLQVNDELGQLQQVLEPALSSLRPGGRMAVISFHSLEDRIVKRFLRDASQPPRLPRKLPLRAAELPAPPLRVVGRAVRPGPEEVARNPRARSAVMRVAERAGGP